MYGGLLRDLFPGEEDRYRIWMDMVQYEVDIGKISEDEFLALLSKECGTDVSVLKKRSYEYAKLNLPLFSLIRTLKLSYKIGLLTNAPRSIIEGVLKDELGLFDEVLISGDIGFIKPHAEIFNQFIANSGFLPKQIFFTDDNARNVAAARIAGMRSALYTDMIQLSRDLELEGITDSENQTVTFS
jgi:FMN phosphatase YigB (HAD superfamily)